ncbi:unnamed protein product [Paramecium octaurelia]|uniref:Uncharacterized protein n=1 Tax=Paramecium octaurelia TaxID=43137 RepID=A0A8S1XYR9_PAROT|nr:unnamed protein product [Paramecium octaurelia]
MQDTRLVSFINYSKKEKEIRKTPEYSELLSQLQPGGKVIKYQSDELDISLTSNFGDKKIRQIKVAICIEGCNHEIFDLYDILQNQVEISCKQCNKKATKKNIKKEEFYTTLIKNMSEKSFSCSFIGQLCFHSFSKDIQPMARELLKKNQYIQLFTAIVQNSKSKAEALKDKLLHLIDQKQRELNQNNAIHMNRILEFSFQCLITYQKIIIPVQFSECKHLDCYEFTNILKLIDDEKKLPEQFQRSFVKCYYQDCQTQIPLDLNQLKQKLLFSYDLARAISKNYPFSLNLIWDFQKSGFEYQKIKIYEFLKNKDLIKFYQNETGLDYTILSLFKKIINKELSTSLQNQLNFSKYKVNLEHIQFPCRCNQCQLQNVKDIEDFILSHFIQEKQEKLKYFICPACNFKHNNPKKLEQLIYFDGYLYNAIQKTSNRQQFEYNKCDDKYQKFFQSHQIIDFKQIKAIYQKTKIYPYPKQFCALSKTQLNLPLTLIYCQEKLTVELKGLKKLLKKTNFNFQSFLKCDCQFCKEKGQLQLTDFYWDPFYYNILSQGSEPNLFEFIKTELTNYLENTQVNEIPNIQKIIQKYNEIKQHQDQEQQQQKQYQQQQQQYQQQQQQYQQQQQQQQLQQQSYQIIEQQSEIFQLRSQLQQYQYQPQVMVPPQYNQPHFNHMAQATKQHNQEITQTQQFVFENGQLIPLQLYNQRFQ